MIDPSLFEVSKLIAALLDDDHGNRDRWRRNAEIVPDYMPPFPRRDTKPTCVVRYADASAPHPSFLRHSGGPRQGHFWDIYGDNYLTPELALIALLEAPVPPFLLKASAWAEAPAKEGA